MKTWNVRNEAQGSMERHHHYIVEFVLFADACAGVRRGAPTTPASTVKGPTNTKASTTHTANDTMRKALAAHRAQEEDEVEDGPPPVIGRPATATPQATTLPNQPAPTPPVATNDVPTASDEHPTNTTPTPTPTPTPTTTPTPTPTHPSLQCNVAKTAMVTDPTPEPQPEPTQDAAPPTTNRRHLWSTIRCDGACHGNGKVGAAMSIGVFVVGPSGQEQGYATTLPTIEGQKGTNNVAEWAAMLASMRLGVACTTSVHIVGDAEMVVEQLNGRRACRDAKHVPYFEACRKLAAENPHIDVKHEKRASNVRADKLAGDAIKDDVRDERLVRLVTVSNFDLRCLADADFHRLPRECVEKNPGPEGEEETERTREEARARVARERVEQKLVDIKVRNSTKRQRPKHTHATTFSRLSFVLGIALVLCSLWCGSPVGTDRTFPASAANFYILLQRPSVEFDANSPHDTLPARLQSPNDPWLRQTRRHTSTNIHQALAKGNVEPNPGPEMTTSRMTRQSTRNATSQSTPSPSISQPSPSPARPSAPPEPQRPSTATPPTPPQSQHAARRALSLPEIEALIATWGKGTTFTITWCFAPPGEMEEKTWTGTVSSRRNGKLTVSYERDGGGVQTGTLPPDARIITSALTAIKVENTVRTQAKTTTERDVEEATSSHTAFSTSSVDNDKTPMRAGFKTDTHFLHVYVTRMNAIIRPCTAADTVPTDEQNDAILGFLSGTKNIFATGPRPGKRGQSRANDTGTTRTQAQRILGRAIRLAQEGFVGKAARTLDTVTHDVPDVAKELLLQRLMDLHPKGTSAPPPPRHVEVAPVQCDELLAAAKHNCSGAAAGLSGMTDELFYRLCLDPRCLTPLTNMLTWIVNGRTSEEVRLRIIRCRLIALLKPDGGVRPIAIGETILKIASMIMANRNNHALAKHFEGLQFGCLAKGGAEIVAHNTRLDVSKGRAVMTIDARNAFNCPARTAMAACVYAIPEIASMWPLFFYQYGVASELFLFRDGEYSDTVRSESGSRQGTLDGGIYFNIVFHPILKWANNTFPTVNVYGYADDLTLTCVDAETLARMFPLIREKCAEIGLQIHVKKCEFFGNGTPMPASLSTEGVTEVFGCVKVVGAYVGNVTAVRAKLEAKLIKHDVMFARLRELGPGTQAFTILTQCLVPRQGYVIRVQTPEESDVVCTMFDERVSNVLQHWFQVDITERKTHSLLGLPRRLGGAGIRWSHEDRVTAYAASHHSSLEALHRETVAVAPMSQRDAADERHKAVAKELSKDAATKKHLEECSLDHAGRWMIACKAFMSSPLFAACMRLRLMAPNPSAPAQSQCLGCKGFFDDTAVFQRHIIGCASFPGTNATMKHHHCVRFLAGACKDAGLYTVIEPRGFESYKCTTCKCTLSAEQARVHAFSSCTGNVMRSGPDIKISWGAAEAAAVEEVYYDFTCVHTTSRSHADTSADKAIAEVTRNKRVKYVDSGMIASDAFEVIAVTALGYLPRNVVQLLREIATVARSEIEVLLDGLATCIQRGNGATLRAVKL